MIYIKTTLVDLYKDLLNNIDDYNRIYVISLDKPTGTMLELDGQEIFYLNPKEEIKFEIAYEVLKHEIYDEKVGSLAICHTQHLKIKEIKMFMDLPIPVHFFGLWSDKYYNVYSSSKYLRNLSMESDDFDN